LLLRQLSYFFILTLLEGSLLVSIYHVSHRFFLHLLLDNLLCSSIFVGLDLCNEFFLLVGELLNVKLALLYHYKSLVDIVFEEELGRLRVLQMLDVVYLTETFFPFALAQ